MGGLLVSLCWLTGCSSVSVQTIQYVGAPRFPQSAPSHVQVLQAAPSRPFERLGEVVLNVSTQPAPPITEIESRLRQRAAAMGADAVYVASDRIETVGSQIWGPPWAPSVTTIQSRVIDAVAIKYKPAKK